MEVIAVINQKGGVGKSTTTLSVGTDLSMRGYKVLFIDLDAQGNLSHTIHKKRTKQKFLSSIDVLGNEVTALQSVQHTEQGDIILSSPVLSGADTIINTTGKEYRLRDALKPIYGLYDYIVIDTPPALGVLTVNALTACTGCIIPAQADPYSLEGIKQLYETIEIVKQYCNANIKVLGIVITRYNGRAIIGREVAEMMEQTARQLNTKVYKTKIRECTAIKESQAVRQSIQAYAPKCNASLDYTALVDEILEKRKAHDQ